MTKPTLYCALFSPPARACMITAKLIGLDMDLKLVDFSKKEHLSEEFLKLNPQHQIPVFIDTDGEKYADGIDIILLIVSKYAPNDKLYPSNLYLQTLIAHHMFYGNGRLLNVLNDMMARHIYGAEGEFNPKTLEMCHDAYGFLAKFLEKGDYFGNKEMSIADVCINTSMVTLNMMIPVDKERYPQLSAWMERMKSLPDYEEVNVKGARELCSQITTMMAENKAKAN